MARNQTIGVGLLVVMTLMLGTLLFGLPQGSSTAHAADASTIVVTRSDCRALVEHEPAAGVEYQPGVDIRGRPVVPAEVSGTPHIALPDEIVIDVTVQVYKFLGHPAPPGLGDSKGSVGRLVVSDGKLSFNGEPLSDPANHAIATACAEKFGRKQHR